MATAKQSETRFRVTLLVPASKAQAVAQQVGGATVESVEKLEPFIEGEWSKAKWDDDHYNEKLRGKDKDDEWINTDGRTIKKHMMFAEGQEKVPFKDRKRVPHYYVADQYGSIAHADDLKEAKKLVRSVGTTGELLKAADYLAQQVLLSETYGSGESEAARDYLAMRRVVVEVPEQDEDGRRKPQYHVNLLIEGSVLQKVEKDAKAAFGEKLRSVTKVEHGFSRADDLMRAKATVEEAAEIISELRSDIEQWYENLPDNFRDGDKGNELQECQSALEDLEQQLEISGWDNIEFPGMY